MTEAEFWKDIGRKIALARQSIKINQTQLAARMKLSRASIANIEAGRQKMNLWQAKQFEKALALNGSPVREK